jgi:hypothetical protein
MQSVPIITNFVSSNLICVEVYSIQLYVIKFDSDLRQGGGGVSPGTPVSSTNITDSHDISRWVFGHLEPGRTLRTGSDK